MNKLPENPTLKNFQAYIKAFCIERGWDKNDYHQIFLLMMEEVGELAKAMRNHAKLYAEKERAHKQFELEEEFADVFSYLLDLANYFDIDLEEAFRKKDKINASRIWE